METYLRDRHSVMITRLDQIEELPIIVVFYRSGSSGEFLSYAIGKTFDGMTQTRQFWENNNRCKYFDVFDRNLNSGFSTIDPLEVVTGVNRYLEKNNPVDSTHVATAHDNPATCEFLHRYLPDVPVIEMVVNNPLSKKFMVLAAQSKITHQKIHVVERPLSLKADSGQKFKNHLQIEWEDFVITRPELVFQEIAEFIGHTGNVEAFCSCVEDYRNRNLELIARANES